MFRRFFNWFRDLDRQFPWSFLGWLVGALGLVVGVGLAIYFGVYYERPTEISFEVLSSTPVLDIKEDIGKGDIGPLRVLYRGENLREQNKQLTIMIVRIGNTGETTILKNQYDEDRPLGIAVRNGAFAEPPYSIDYSDARLMNPPAPDPDPDAPRTYISSITYPAHILEPGDYWTERMLIIHDKDETPEVIPTGKVGGIREIPVYATTTEAERSERRDIGLWPGLVTELTGLVSIFVAFIGILFMARKYTEKTDALVRQVSAAQAGMQADVERTRSELLGIFVQELKNVYVEDAHGGATERRDHKEQAPHAGDTGGTSGGTSY